MQCKIDSFFKITTTYNERNKKCFVYDPQNYTAFFATKPNKTDIFVVLKSGIKLFYRYMPPKNICFPTIDANYGIPLLKSNLQKAIRRCDNSIAIQSSLAILQKNPLELLRRLPIIYIEDVCLMDSYSIIIWLMIADKNYNLTTTDIDIILNIVNSLCNCKEYFNFGENDCENESEYNFSHESLQDYPNYNELLSIYYRSKYGGMKGDMLMLKTAVEFYKKSTIKIPKTSYNCVEIDKIEINIEILVEAIDFHPFPQLLNSLSMITKINKQTIKDLLWFIESGYNIRKPFTVENSLLFEKKAEWKIIEPHLDDLRNTLILI
jgi:hypothetical protein